MEAETIKDLERKIILKKQLIDLTRQEIYELIERLLELNKKEKASESTGT